MTRYRCLVLDHDDTAVMSTPAIHFPSFLDTLARLRPGTEMTIGEYSRLCFDPGFERMCYEVFHFTPEEMAWQLENWQRHVERQIPPFHAGMPELIRRQKAAGGLVCVISQSYSRFVLRDYAAAGLPAPDLCIGWEIGSALQKPNPYPLRETLRRFRLSPANALVVDDLKPGYDMARAAGCDFAAALWAYADDPEMQLRVLSGCPGAIAAYTPQEIESLLFR
ncbi:MAG: HAD family hydrolase [Clostridia bacterium]|nr:HAD family hydrolase [Clostridia bacterium]